MSVLNKLATTLGRRDEVPNKELAAELVKSGDKKAIRELVDHLFHRDRNIQSDCIKVLYEVGEQKPDLIAAYVPEFIKLVNASHNRLVWGAMIALHWISEVKPEAVFKHLDKIMEAVDKGSVITRDHAVGILATLASHKKYAGVAWPLLLEQIKTSPVNQFPTYAENAMPVVPQKFKSDFIKVLTGRLKEMTTESKKKRLEKVIRNLRFVVGGKNTNHRQ